MSRSPTVFGFSLQSLEVRDIPSVSIVNARTAKFIDVDGDVVIVKTSVGTLTSSLFTAISSGAGEQLQRLNLSGGGFERTNLAITAIRTATGDGLVNIGFIDSTGHDLGSVSITGDLGKIDAGDSDPKSPALKSLHVTTLGLLGTSTQVSGGGRKALSHIPAPTFPCGKVDSVKLTLE